MIHVPGTQRRCAMPVPEEVLLKLALLDIRLEWRADVFAWAIYRAHDGWDWSMFIDAHDPDWDAWLTMLADHVGKPTVPAGWQNTQRVDTMPIEAAAVINEEAF